MMKISHPNLLCENIEYENSWEINLVGNDGSFSTDVMSLVLFSPLLQKVLLEQQDKPYPTIVLLPDFSVIQVELLAEVLKTGNVFSSQEGISSMLQLAVALGIELSPNKYIISKAKGTDAAGFWKASTFSQSDELLVKSDVDIAVQDILKEYVPTTSYSPRSESDDSSDEPTEAAEPVVQVEEPKPKREPTYVTKDGPIYECGECNKIFGTLEMLERHEKFKHRDTSGRYQCMYCGYSTGNSALLKDHEAGHQGIKRFKCNECGKCFVGRPSLVRHKKLHSDEFKFQCEKCGKKFKFKSAFDTHHRWHNNERPYVCQLCMKRFVTRSKLKTHMDTAHDEPKYECEVCKKKFGRKDGLNVHMFSHATQSNFMCTLCGKMYRQKDTLAKHMKKHAQ